MYQAQNDYDEVNIIDSYLQVMLTTSGSVCREKTLARIHTFKIIHISDKRKSADIPTGVQHVSKLQLYKEP